MRSRRLNARNNLPFKVIDIITKNFMEIGNLARASAIFDVKINSVLVTRSKQALEHFKIHFIVPGIVILLKITVAQFRFVWNDQSAKMKIIVVEEVID